MTYERVVNAHAACPGAKAPQYLAFQLAEVSQKPPALAAQDPVPVKRHRFPAPYWPTRHGMLLPYPERVSPPGTPAPP